MTRVLLLHGWDWEKYPVFKPQHQWQNRQELVMELRKHYDVGYPSLPGFSRNDAHRTGSWTLDDYADWLQGEIIEKRYGAVIGYSFGCAVATHWQYLHRNASVPLILLSPAVARHGRFKIKNSRTLGVNEHAGAAHASLMIFSVSP